MDCCDDHYARSELAHSALEVSNDVIMSLIAIRWRQQNLHIGSSPVVEIAWSESN
jgi:hypothetical protein